jgi:hypothetical protein
MPWLPRREEPGRGPSVWVILPTLNEAGNIERWCAPWRGAAAMKGFDLNVVVVDDNS